MGSVLPAGSVARTWKVWVPWVSPVYWRGEVHAVKAAPSRAHSNVDPASSAAKVKRGRGAGGRVGRAGSSIVVCGGVVSAAWIVQVWVAGVGSVLPAGSVARTWKVWEPSASPVYWRGEVHARERRAVQGALEGRPGLVGGEGERGRGARWSGRPGRSSMVVCGGVVSVAWIVQVWVAGVGSVLPAGSVAADLEGVGALGQPGVLARGGARR